MELHWDGNLGLLLVFLSALEDTGSLAPWLPGSLVYQPSEQNTFASFFSTSCYRVYIFILANTLLNRSPNTQRVHTVRLHSCEVQKPGKAATIMVVMGGRGREWLEGVSRGLLVSHWFCFLFFFFWPYHTAGGILVPQPGIQTAPPALEVQSLNPWTTREVLILLLDLNTNMFPSWKFIKLCA